MSVLNASALTQREPLVGIQLLRGVAAIAVVFHHAGRKILDATGHEPVMSLNGLGNRGVELFFVLSGFIIMHAHFADSTNGIAAGRYWYRRLTRIIPMTFLVATATCVISYLRHLQDPLPIRDSFMIWLNSAFILPMTRWPDPIVIWSLRHEMLFYVIFSLGFINKRLMIGMIMFWSALCLLFSFGEYQQFLFTLFSNYNMLFIFGIVAWILFTKKYKWVENYYMLALSTAGFCLAAWIFRSSAGHNSHAWMFFGSSAALMIASFARLKTHGRVAATAKFLGDASFSIYLVHYFFVSAVVQVMLKIFPAPELAYIMASLVGISVGIIFFLFVERSLLRMTTRFMPLSLRSKPEPTPVAVA